MRIASCIKCHKNNEIHALQKLAKHIDSKGKQVQAKAYLCISLNEQNLNTTCKTVAVKYHLNTNYC